MCSLTTGCVLILQGVFSDYRMCSLTTECVLLPEGRLGGSCGGAWLGTGGARSDSSSALQENTFYSKGTHSIVREQIL
jgi:hypothetical protein